MTIKFYDFENINLLSIIDFLNLERNWIEREYNKNINDCKIAIFAHSLNFYSNIEKLEKQGYIIYNYDVEDFKTVIKNGKEITLKDITI